MDKYEYKLMSEEMLELMKNGAYNRAAEIADAIDWRKVRNTTMLTNVSDIYEKTGNYYKSYEVLNIAYHRTEGSRKVLYRLCELAVRTGHLEEAIDYYDRYRKMAPKDPNQYILKYKILKAKRAPIGQQIQALKAFKDAEYIEEWAYELAKKYQEAGLIKECIEECDDLILWFSEGKYVYKAMELKLQYQPLTPSQLEKYNHRFDKVEIVEEEEVEKEPEIKKKPVDPNRPKVTIDLKEAMMETEPPAEEVTETEPEFEEQFIEPDEEIVEEEPEESEEQEEPETKVPLQDLSEQGRVKTMKLEDALKSLLHPEEYEAEHKEEQKKEQKESEDYKTAIEEIEAVMDLDLVGDIPTESEEDNVVEKYSDPEITELTLDDIEDTEPEEDYTDRLVSDDITEELPHEVLEKLQRLEARKKTKGMQELFPDDDELDKLASKLMKEVAEEVAEDVSEEIDEQPGSDDAYTIEDIEIPEDEEVAEEKIKIPEIEELGLLNELVGDDEFAEEFKALGEDFSSLKRKVIQEEEEVSEDQSDEPVSLAIEDETELPEKPVVEETVLTEEQEEKEVLEDLVVEDDTDLPDKAVEEKVEASEKPEVEEIETLEGPEVDMEKKNRKVTPILPPDIQKLIDEIEGIIPTEHETAEPVKSVENVPQENMGEVTEQLRVDEFLETDVEEELPAEEAEELEEELPAEEAEELEEELPAEEAEELEEELPAEEAEELEEELPAEEAEELEEELPAEEAEELEEELPAEEAEELEEELPVEEAEELEEELPAEEAEELEEELPVEEAEELEEELPTEETEEDLLVDEEDFVADYEEELLEDDEDFVGDFEEELLEDDEDFIEDYEEEELLDDEDFVLDYEEEELLDDDEDYILDYEEEELLEDDGDFAEEEEFLEDGEDFVEEEEFLEDGEDFVEEEEFLEDGEDFVEEEEFLEDGEDFVEEEEFLEDGEDFVEEEEFSEDEGNFVEEDYTTDNFDVNDVAAKLKEEFRPDPSHSEGLDDREIPDEDDVLDIMSATTPLSRKETAKLHATGKTGSLPVDEISDALSMSSTGFVVHGRYDLDAQSGIGTRAGLTDEQKQLFSYFVPVRGMSEQLVDVLEQDRNCTNRGGTSRTGNLLIIGNKGNGKTVLAVDVVKAIQKQRNIRQGKVAIVTGESLNKKRISEICDKLYGGALIIEKAAKMNEKTVARLNKAMERDTGELLIVLEEQRKPLERLLSSNREFRRKFTCRLEVPIFINDELVTFGQTYAQENGYKIDELGILALYSRIDMLQREDHAVTIAEVKEVMDEAIGHSQKSSAKKLVKRVFGRGTDENDKILLSEKDFNI